MPLLHISMRAGTPAAHRQAIFDSLYRAMRETLDVPEDDQFMTIREHDAANFRYSASCYGVSRSEDVVYIQITVFDTRTAQQKKALFKRTAELLGKNPGIRPENVFVNVLESAKENWSVGHGLAQFALGDVCSTRACVRYAVARNAAASASGLTSPLAMSVRMASASFSSKRLSCNSIW